MNRQDLAGSMELGSRLKILNHQLHDRYMTKLPLGISLLLCIAGLAANGQVVINEIMYHAPNDLDDLEFIEFYNAGKEAVDLSGWAVNKGIDHKFVAGTKITPDGYLVLCRNRDRFKQQYGFEPGGVFEKSLSNDAEKIELINAQGKKVDAVHYQSHAPWPMGPDGGSSSLERICPSSKGNLAENWASSAPSPDRLKPAGSPGKRNGSFSATLPPVISVKAPPGMARPGEPLLVEATVKSKSPVKEVSLRYRVAGAGTETKETAIPMTHASGEKFTAQIPGQKTNQIVRYRIVATDHQGATRTYPAENEPRPALSSFVFGGASLGKIPGAMIFHPDEAAFKKAQQQRKSGNRGGMMMSEEDQQRWGAYQILENGLNLPDTWAQILIEQNAGFETRTKMQPVFAARQKEKEQLIEKTVEAPDLKDQMPKLPEKVKAFRSDLAAALKPALTKEQGNQLTEWQQQTGAASMQWGPDTALRRIVPVELAFYGATRRDINAGQFEKLKNLSLTLLKERSGLTNAIKDAMSGKGDWGKVQEQGQELSEKLRKEMETVLTPDQVKEIAQENQPPSFMRFRGGSKPGGANPRRAAFVFIDEKSGVPQLFDFVDVEPRSAGFKVHFHKDQPLRGMTGINLIFEYNDRFVLAEPLAYEVYRRVGNAAPLADFYRLWVDGDVVGYHLMVEQPNRSFLSRNKIKGDGNMYKILWYEQGVVGQHEKKMNVQTGHDDLVKLVDSLEKTRGAEQWAVIEKNFNVGQVINYFALNMCLSHWDGFFNNYFTYHDLKGTGKWEMYPWDQDKTWGFYDGLQEGAVFYDMPITMGMEGDSPPWAKKGEKVRGFRGGHWWREGGYFSKPLLANPEFRKRFLARTKEILEKVYTEASFFPVIDGMRERLKEEVALRAAAIHEDPKEAEDRFEKNLASLKEHLVKRRQFLLAQDELR